MNKCQIAEYFEVSRPTVNDWTRRGCPIGADGDMDPGAVAEWRCRRDFERAGLPPGRLPELVGQLTRERLSLGERIQRVNEMPAGTDAKPNLLKVAVVSRLILERELLTIPGKILSGADPVTLPEKIYELTLAALQAARGEDPATSPAPADTRRVAASPGTGPRRGTSKKERGLEK
jgi:hypothetical protein